MKGEGTRKDREEGGDDRATRRGREKREDKLREGKRCE